MGSALQRLTALLLLSGAAALRLPHVQAPSGPLKASRRGGKSNCLSGGDVSNLSMHAPTRRLKHSTMIRWVLFKVR